MKSLLILVCFSLAVIAATAQTKSPVIVSTPDKNTLLYVNTSPKAILVFIGTETYSSGDVTTFGMDSLDNATAFPAGETHTQWIPDDDPNAKYFVTFVQFIDGSTWGDSSTPEAKLAASKRQTKLSFLATLANTSSVDDFKAKLDAMPKKPDDPNGKYSGAANSLRGQVITAGADVAWQHVKARYAVAQSRQNFWTF